MSTKHDWEGYYQEATDLPWDTGLPCPELVEYFQSPPEGIKPRAVLEVGCGTGTNAVWLAREQDCTVTATEIAPTALAQAKKRAEEAKRAINLIMADICVAPPVELSSQDFAFDRGVFHVIPEEQRSIFAQNLALSLKPGAYWLTLAGSKDEVRENPEMGPPQLTAVQLIEKVEPHFEVIRIERSRFLVPDGRSYLSWLGLFRRR